MTFWTMPMPGLMRGKAAGGVEFVGSGNGHAASGTGLSVGRPSQVKNGDLMLAMVAANGTARTVSTAPVGWTLIDSSIGTNPPIYFYQKVAGNSEPGSYSWVWDASSNAKLGIIVAYRNHNGIDVAGGIARATSDTLNIPSITATKRGALVGFWVQNFSWPLSAGPTGMELRGSLNSAAPYGWVYDLIPSSIGATGTKSLSVSGGAAFFAGILIQIAGKG